MKKAQGSTYVDPLTPLRCAAEEAERARDAIARRDGWIAEARHEGSTLRAIGLATGLSHTAIAKILDRAGTVP